MSDLISDGKTRVVWATSLSSQTAPTATELNAASDYTQRITPDGLKIDPTTAEVDTSSLASRFDTAEAGRTKFALELTFKKGTTTPEQLPWSTLVFGTHGFVVVRRGVAFETAFATGDAVEVYPVVCGEPAEVAPAPNEVGKFMSKMMLTAAPTTRAVVA